MAKKKIAVTIETPLPTKKRKGTLAKGAVFQVGNQFAFKKGQSGNPSGRPKDETRLLSKAIRAHLGHRAPDEVASAFQLAKGASWAQCIAASLVRRAIRNDNSAVSIILNATEPASRNGLDPLGLDGESMGGVVPELHISLVQAKPIEAPQPPTISAHLEESSRG